MLEVGPESAARETNDLLKGLHNRSDLLLRQRHRSATGVWAWRGNAGGAAREAGVVPVALIHVGLDEGPHTLFVGFEGLKSLVAKARNVLQLSRDYLQLHHVGPSLLARVPAIVCA